LDELREGVRILEACTWVEAGRPKKFPVALDAAVDPPCPHLEAFSPAADFHSGHQGDPFLRVGAQIFARVGAACLARKKQASRARRMVRR
jgi:hypothetical protein